MNALGIAIIASMFALPAAGVIIIVVCVVGDIKSHKEMQRFKEAMHRCESVRGWEFTSRLLDRCSKSHLPVKNRIELLEHFASIS